MAGVVEFGIRVTLKALGTVLSSTAVPDEEYLGQRL